METIEINSVSAEDNSSTDTNNLQHPKSCNNENSFCDSIDQLADKDIQPQNIHKETVKHSCSKQFCKIALLACIILFVIGVMQIPITLYATAPPFEGSTNMTFDLVDFKSCSVSYIIQ